MIADSLTWIYTAGFLALGFYGLRMFGLTVAWWCLRSRVEASAPVDDALVVTVQLPIYNERHVSARVIDAACRLDWPRERIEIQVLDDSTDDTREIIDASVRAWQARGVDIQVIRRPDRAGYKAGALAVGLAQARGDALAVFDADFVPPPDFLAQTLPHLLPGVGVVQARWGHLNASESWLTRAQALALDGYFMIEQTVHARLGCFLTFNGTAGVWRRAAIEAAGGWQGDTLTEDVDLSYRAQMAGWRIVFLPSVVAPAELPATQPAFRRQQFRWAKGTIQVLRKLGASILSSDRPPAVRLLACVTLSGYLVFPITLGLLLGGPLLLLFPPDFPHALQWLGLVPLGSLAMFASAESAIGSGWPRRILAYPYLVVLTIGLSLVGTRAVVEGLIGRKSAFERTPKTGAGIEAEMGGDLATGEVSAPHKFAARPMMDRTGYAELGLALYAWGGFIAAWAQGAYGLLFFFGLYAIGFSLTAGLDLSGQAGGSPRMRRAPTP